MTRSLPALLLTAALACTKTDPLDILGNAEWIDLSHDFSPETIYWPTAKPFKLEVVSAQRTPAGYYYAANNFSAAEHGGTHLDAPIHFGEGQWTADQIQIERLVGRGIVVDVEAQVGSAADYRVTRGDVEGWERAHGSIPSGSIVLFRTGWGRRWPDRGQYLGTGRTGPEGAAELHFPGIDSAAAALLVERSIGAVGIDTPSIDHGQSRTFPTHQVLFGANIAAFENVANLDQLPAKGAFIVALPMKIKGGSGGPLRIVAAVRR